MTRREKATQSENRKYRRWVGKLIIGANFVFLGGTLLPDLDRFWTGLQTYFWDHTEGQVIASDLTVRDRSGSGEVTYTVSIEGQDITRTEEIFKRWSGNEQKWEQETEHWIQSYEEGSPVTIYYADAERLSLGHWPAEWAWNKGVSAAFYLLSGFGLILAALHDRKHGPLEPKKAEKGWLSHGLALGLIVIVGTGLTLGIIETGFGVSAGGWLAGLIAAFWAFIGWLVAVGMKKGKQESPAEDAAAG